MRCPKCDSNNVYVTNTMTSADNEVLRRRKCPDCFAVFKTIEIVAEETEEFKKKYLTAVEAKHPVIKESNEARREAGLSGFERRVCPFCGQAHIGDRCVNTICACGAKYYPCTQEWLNRKTGEIKKGRE